MILPLPTLLCGALLGAALWSATLSADPVASRWSSITFADDRHIKTEIADTPAQRALGLMYRETLGENQGMLFVYPDSDIRYVWMKNTLLALDIVFLNENGIIVSMLPNLAPCTQQHCPIYPSKAVARYMLEVNAGFIDKHQLKTGQEVIIDYRH